MDQDQKGKYGLVFLPKNKPTHAGSATADPGFELGKQKIDQQLANRGNVFGDVSSSSEESSPGDEHDRGAPKKKLPTAPAKVSSVQQKQAKMVMKKALEDDPSIYEYDEIYDNMQEKVQQKKEAQKSSVDRKPKYIENLLKTSARRQREYEAKIERDVQKEREKEGDEFKDKEEFVTSAYRKKMEELQKIKEEEERLDAIDTMTDVSKQKDLSGFYRHLYRTTVDTEKKDESSEKPPTAKPPRNRETAESRRQRRSPSPRRRRRTPSPRRYRRSPSPRRNRTSPAPRRNIRSPSPKRRYGKSSPERARTRRSPRRSRSPRRQHIDVKKPQTKEIKQEVSPKAQYGAEEKPEKISIWVKRTVGPILDEARARYLERKGTLQVAIVTKEN